MKFHDFKREQYEGIEEDMCAVCRNGATRINSYAYDHQFILSDLCGWTRGIETYTELIELEEM